MKEYHKSALLETFFILIFAILPTIFRGLQIFFTNDAIPISTLYKSGEFFLYSITLLSSSYLVYNHFKIKKSDLNGIFSFMAILLMVIFSLSYTALTNTNSPNIERLKYFSIGAFILSIPIFYIAQVTSNRHSPDIGAKRKDEQQIIENALS